jgi:hypothetical protein
MNRTVNFLSHDFVLPPASPPLTRVGSALPDLWSLLERRPLPLVVQRRLDASPSTEGRELGRGIRSHLAADAAFHALPAFRDRVAWLAPQLAPAWDGLRHASLAAHVLVEMILDAWIVARQPQQLDSYYDCFTSHHIRIAAQHSASDPAMEGGVTALLNRFASIQFLRDYDTTEGTVDRFVRLLTHTPFASGTQPDFPRLVHLTGAATHQFESGSLDMLEAVRAASDAALG